MRKQKPDPHRTAEEAKRIYDSPDRDDVTRANEEMRDAFYETPKKDSEGPGSDPVVSGNVRKPV